MMFCVCLFVFAFVWFSDDLFPSLFFIYIFPISQQAVS